MSIKKRILSNGETVYDIRVQYGGSRIAKTVRATQTQAKRVEAKIMLDLIDGKFDILKNKLNPKFSVYAEEYKQQVTWQKTYKETIRLVKILVSVFGKNKLTEITPQVWLTYRSQRIKQVTNASINREYSCLKKMLNDAIKSDEYLIQKNPIDKVKQLPEAPVENRDLEPWEYQKLLEAAPEYFRRILYFACNTGARQQEILSLKIRQIKLRDFSSEIELADTKSGKREAIPIHQGIIDLLQEIAKARGIDIKHLTEAQKEEYVFHGKYNNNRLFSVKKPMKTTFRKAGIPYHDFHTFRHFWTTEMFNAGIDVSIIQKIGRWRDLKTMLRYCHTRKPRELDAVNTLNEHLSKTAGNVIIEMPKKR